MSSDGSLSSWQYTSSLSSTYGLILGVWTANNYLYVLGANNIIERAQQNIDGTLATWQVVNANVPAFGPIILTPNNQLILIGYGENVYTASFSSDTGIGNWLQNTQPMVQPRGAQSATLIGSDVYVVGGGGNGAFIHQVEFISSQQVTGSQ